LFQAVQGPLSDGVDILVREDLRFEGELPDSLTQSTTACCPGHNQAPNLLLLSLCLIDAALILTGPRLPPPGRPGNHARTIAIALGTTKTLKSMTMESVCSMLHATIVRVRGSHLVEGSSGTRSRTTTPVKKCPVFCPMSRFHFSGQLREEGDIAVEFLRQTTDDCPGRHHLAVDHLKQLHRVDAQLSRQLEDVRASGAHKSATCLLNSQTFGSGISGKYESQVETIDELLMN
jgi:hypothetical protein